MDGTYANNVSTGWILKPRAEWLARRRQEAERNRGGEPGADHQDQAGAFGLTAGDIGPRHLSNSLPEAVAGSRENKKAPLDRVVPR